MLGQVGEEGVCMVDVGYGSPGLGKSLRSLVDILRGLEREVEILFERSGGDPDASVDDRRSGWRALAPWLGGFARAWAPEPAALAREIARLAGLADAASLHALRADLERLAARVADGGARDRAVADEIRRLRALVARLEGSVEGMARMQGRTLARLRAHQRQLRHVERLTTRRDDHITRLIRDTAGQRAELEKLAGRHSGESGPPAEAATRLDETRKRLEQVESRLSDLRRMQSAGAQNVIETLESIRDRVARLEVRAAEMTREARAKGGRLDALARHVANVDNRLSAALGRHRDALARQSQSRETSVSATG